MSAARFRHRVGQLAAPLLATLLMVAPGLAGDNPAGFRVDDCKTQRNLDDAGREQGRALGEAFRKHGVRVDRIVSSPVCRCMETGQLMAVGAVETSWTLLPDTGSSAIRVLGLEEMVSSWRGPGTLVLVTHGLTVGRLTGFTLEQAETLVLPPTPEKLPVGHLPRGGRLAGRIPPPQ